MFKSETIKKLRNGREGGNAIELLLRMNVL